MFNSFLSGKIFAIPYDFAITARTLASSWSGQTFPQEPSDRVCWEEADRVETAARAPWYLTPPPAMISVQNGLVLLAQDRESHFFTFISPLTGISNTFKLSASMYLQKHSSGKINAVNDVSVDLTAFVKDRWEHLSGMIKSMEGKTMDGCHMAITFPYTPGNRPGFFDYLETVTAIEIDTGSHRTKIDQQLNIEVGDVSKPFDSIASSLQETFSMVKPFCSTNSYQVPSFG